MKYRNLLFAISSSLVIASCGSSDNETQATTTPVTTETNNQITSDTTPSSGTIAAPTIATTPSTATQTAATTSSALNPEHGKPGHRCEIAVGAPLNSKPTTPVATTPTVSSTPVNVSAPVVTQSTSPSTTSSKTAGGINPAHGQPGHRCDIAVGASLDSKPVQATIQQPATNTPVPAPKVALPYTPVLNNQPVATTPTAKGMNPAHGQPGHRCDISVGAPLDSKPNTPVVETKPKQ